jgi:hypothetical protein
MAEPPGDAVNHAGAELAFMLGLLLWLAFIIY